MKKQDIIPINTSRRIGDAYRLPFGKYKGQKLSTVPTEYLRWLVSQAWLSEYSRFELMDELGRRGALYHEMVMEIIGLKAEVERLRTALEDVERYRENAETGVETADEEFVRALVGSAESS